MDLFASLKYFKNPDEREKANSLHDIGCQAGEQKCLRDRKQNSESV